MKIHKQANRAARWAARAEKRLAKAELKLTKATGRVELRRAKLAAFEKQFPNLTDGLADSVQPADQMARMAIVRANVKLLNAEAKVDARRARCEAAKRVLEAASEEAKRYGVG